LEREQGDRRRDRLCPRIGDASFGGLPFPKNQGKQSVDSVAHFSPALVIEAEKRPAEVIIQAGLESPGLDGVLRLLGELKKGFPAVRQRLD
jgi:hypothetical protein